MSFPREVLLPMLAKVGAPDALERQHPLKMVGLHDLCEIAEDGGQRSVTARAVFQAGTDGLDRWLLVYTQDDPAAGPPELHAVRNCRVGRAEVDEKHGLVVAELVFDQPIDRGETHLIEYTLTNSGPPYPECRNTHYREFRRPVREYLLEVRFAPGTAPGHCWQYSRNDTMRLDVAPPAEAGRRGRRARRGPRLRPRRLRHRLGVATQESLVRNTFPVALRGSSSRNSTSRGTL